MSVPARPYTPLVNASDAERKLKEKLHRCWKDLQKHCRLLDPENTGTIGQEDFRCKFNFQWWLFSEMCF